MAIDESKLQDIVGQDQGEVKTTIKGMTSQTPGRFDYFNQFLLDLANNDATLKQLITEHQAEDVADGAHGMGAIASQNYEEGTFTPAFEGSSVAGANTYSKQTGLYTRKGNEATVHVGLALSSKDANMEGIIDITGLPFVSGNAAVFPGASIGNFYYLSVPAGKIGVSASVPPNSSKIRLYLLGDNLNIDTLRNTEIQDETTIELSVTYTL